MQYCGEKYCINTALEINMEFCWKYMVTIVHFWTGVSFTHNRWFAVCLWRVIREALIVLYVQGVCHGGWDSLCDSLSVRAREWDSSANTFCEFKWEMNCTVDCIIYEGGVYSASVQETPCGNNVDAEEHDPMRWI